MTSMVERVARAIKDASTQDDWATAAARAAIEAMRNPSLEMMRAARAHHEGEHYLPHSLFNSMIDAALNEQSEGR